MAALDEKEFATEDRDAAWMKYPTNLDAYDCIAVDGTECIEEFNRLSEVLCSKTTDLAVVETLENLSLDKLSIKKEDDLSKFLSKRDFVPKLRIISMWQKFSLSPLSISKSALLRLLSHYQVSPEFLTVLGGFGDKRSSSDEVSETGLYKTLDETSYEISYQLRYMERNKRSRGDLDPWSLRQTGVYHKYTKRESGNGTNLWLLLHPVPKSKVKTRLEEASASDLGVHANNTNDHFRLHLLVFSSYIDNWRPYLHDMTRQFLALEGDLLTSDLQDSEEYTTFNFNTLQTLRHMTGKLIPIPTILEASIKTVASLKKMNETMSPTGEVAKREYHLQAYESKLESYLASCLVLQARIENMTKFLADGLNLRNSKITAEGNGHLVTLTKKTVDDSATVKAITLVTLIYLPATFMSGLFGSNLFNFQDSTSNFQISRQWWIYFAATIPLTALTLGYWQFKSFEQRKKKTKDAATSAHGVGTV